ncbi:GNAT family N-acetyltransferase [Photobacterium sp. OFAV2-7]|uniref:GNAT family N-acetyltransferase n=1 Tax=Photobacterium sp. OFAV2-7 TaxID=2917748 RepID=UPI001EF40ADC|nr:GNAT family N-acetyltransferase [Photobacterium sp. OFAV2-7]MCG7588632.1 GNAT family N-acetyltransferase [Photobacterium sp. OFAV2-7]
MIITETERLRIRQLTEDDAAFALKLYTSEPFLRFVGDKQLKTEADARQYLLDGPIKMYQAHGIGLYLVELKESDVPLGICGLIKRDSLDDVDLGYGFLPEYFGQGYGYESALAVMEYGQRELKMKKLVAITTADNQRCIKLLDKLGLQFVENIEEPEAAPALGLYAMEL